MDYSRQHFEQLYKANYRQMYLAAFALAGDADDAKDIVSQVFTQLWQTKPQVADERLTAYLLVSVRNQWQHMFRQRDSWQQLREELSHTDPEGEDDNVRNELLDELQRVIDTQLSPRDREILALHYGDNLTYAETAEALGLSSATVNKRVTLSLATLRRKLKKTK